MLTDSCSSKELCEFRHSENLTLLNASEIEDVAYKTGTYALARPYGTLRNRSLHMVNRSISNLLFVSTPCDFTMEFIVAHHLLLVNCHYMVRVRLDAKILVNVCLLRFRYYVVEPGNIWKLKFFLSCHGSFLCCCFEIISFLNKTNHMTSLLLDR